MKKTKKASSEGLTRRDLLKASGLALGGLVFGGAMVGAGAGKAALSAQQCGENGCNYPVDLDTTQRYTYPSTLPLPSFTPNTPLEDEEMRITFLGTAFPPNRLAQQMMSIFVEVGPWIPGGPGEPGKATDSFVFDCGSGVLANYAAMGISFGRMDKVFISHLHGDHMSDLSAIYCFGPAQDRKSPLYVFSHGNSGVQNPDLPPALYNDGVRSFCNHLREAMRWHTESFSFLPTASYDTKVPTRKSWGLPREPVPVGGDAKDDGYALVPIELNWKKYGKVPGDNVAYNNPTTHVKITHFPVIHCRQGSMGFKLEWKGLSMIYSSDTRPETMSIEQASNGGKGVDVFIHEMMLPPELLAMKNMGLTKPDYTSKSYLEGLYMSKTIIDSSHSPQGAYGYLLNRIDPHPRLSVIAHFPTADDTVACALKSVQEHCPWVVWNPEDPDSSNLIWSTDRMVLSVKKSGITQMMGKVQDYTFAPPSNMPGNLKTAKYHTASGKMDPTAQLDRSTLIPAGPDTYCEDGY